VINQSNEKANRLSIIFLENLNLSIILEAFAKLYLAQYQHKEELFYDHYLTNLSNCFRDI